VGYRFMTMALKSVLITGCSARGIGSALVEAFQKQNMLVFATARDPSKISHLKEIPNVELLTLEPTSATSVRAAVDIVAAQTGGTLDYLVNNAGQTIIMPTLDFDIETAKSMYEINVWGMVRVTQAFAPLVIEAKGVIANINSISTHVNTPWMGKFPKPTPGAVAMLTDALGLYAGSKAAANAITETLRLEMAPFNVKVVNIVTGAISTNILSNGVNFELPRTSRYKNIEKEIAARARGEDGTPRMEPSLFAEKVVGDILRGANRHIWRGGYASIVRYTSYWFPFSLAVSEALSCSIVYMGDLLIATRNICLSKELA